MKFQAVTVFALVLFSLTFPPAEAELLPQIVAAADYSTLVTLLNITGLIPTLQGALVNGTLTVFAPSNAVFATLPKATVDCLTTTPNGMELLKTVLTYHVAPGRYLPASLVDGMMLKTVAGPNLNVTVIGSTIAVGGVNISAPNAIQDEQGLVHGVAGIILPPGGAALLNSTCSGTGAPTPTPSVPRGPTSAPLSPTTAPAPSPSSAASTLVTTSSALVVLVATFFLF